MKKQKKKTSLLLVTLLFALLLQGCGGPGPAAGTPGEDPAASTTPSITQEPTEGTDAPGPTDPNVGGTPGSGEAPSESAPPNETPGETTPTPQTGAQTPPSGAVDPIPSASERPAPPSAPPESAVPSAPSPPVVPPAPAESQAPVISEVTVLERGLSSADFSGEDGFEDFLTQGGAASDAQVAQFLSGRLDAEVSLSGAPFGCSTLVAAAPGGGAVFGRNFDWQTCDALILTSEPVEGYASISTVNLGFLRQAGGGLDLEDDAVRVFAALYAPLDGMNEKGLAVSVNMIQDAASINQDTGRPDLTTTTAVRLLLNQAADVDEALALLRQYDLHSSMGMMVHFALADKSGRGVAAEYVNNQLVVTETPVVTNFYLAEGPKQGVGTQQSHTRYDTLLQTLAGQETMDMDAVRDALDSVSKHNYGGGESTEWSAVFQLSTGEAHYYHRENYQTRFTFSIG